MKPWAGARQAINPQWTNQPPVKTITWYHTGAALDRQRILSHFAHEYFPARHSFSGGFQEKPLPEPELPADLSADEWREALRACKGMVLRQEVYELDVDDIAALIPKQTPVRIYSAATHNCRIQRLQRRGVNRHAGFLVTESEAVSYQYELALPRGAAALTPDPRIAHTLNLRHDEYGNPQQSGAIGYPRLGNTLPPGLPADAQHDNLIRAVQNELHIAYSETRYTEDVVLPTPAPGSTWAVRHHRLRLPCEVKTYEISGLTRPPPGSYYEIAELRRHALCEDSLYPPPVPVGQRIPLTRLEYHEQPQAAGPHRRIVEHARTLFFADDLNSHRDFGQHGPLALPYENYKLALTKNLLDRVLADSDPLSTRLSTAYAALNAQANGYPVSGYYKGDQLFPRDTTTSTPLNEQYWVASGRAGFASDAALHFYLPEEYTDPFGNKTTLQYDPRDLFIQSSKDALGNTAGIWIDPITLKRCSPNPCN